MEIDVLLRHRTSSLFPHLTKRQRRLAAAADARALGYGGVSRVARAAGMSRMTIHRGLAELDRGELSVNEMQNSEYTTPVAANRVLYVTNRRTLFAIQAAP
ncbi:MAG: hypothetical protein V1790_16840 [Planctomycetota bacterium]